LLEKTLGRGGLDYSQRIRLHAELGKHYDRLGVYPQAFSHYHEANEIEKQLNTHIREQGGPGFPALSLINSWFTQFDARYWQQLPRSGVNSERPVFVVGMPRSGTTLAEQILASHSQVEGTAELPVIGRITESIGRYRADGVRYPEAVRELRDKDLRAYGRQYINETRRYRSTDKPLFTDKLPNNFPMLGFVRLILPNAKFINARRHPFDTCLGNYKQLFGRGQNFTYDMLDLAHYYQQYVATMQHWHEVMPGQVLDVHYEETVTDLEGQVRRILDHCGLPFEESCLHYYETDRAVKTASSEQVRQPIYTSALGKWRRYDKHLDVWKKQLGHIVEQLPEASKNAGL